MASKTPFLRLLEYQPQLFSEQFTNARWLFVPLCGNKHWILAAVDLKNTKITLYQSCNAEANQHYLEPHVDTLDWLKFFLSWRMGNENWDSVEVKFEDNVPKQDGSDDCAIFLLRYMDCIIRNVPMDFDQDIIRKERLCLAYNILIHDRNDRKFI